MTGSSADAECRTGCRADARRLRASAVACGDFSNNHQVLAYGYQRSGQNVTLYIYDPNHGQKETTYQFKPSS
jgi:hypothetical protein